MMQIIFELIGVLTVCLLFGAAVHKTVDYWLDRRRHRTAAVPATTPPDPTGEGLAVVHTPQLQFVSTNALVHELQRRFPHCLISYDSGGSQYIHRFTGDYLTLLALSVDAQHTLIQHRPTSKAGAK
jgi:hypothetical protein